jgi:peptidoglycan/LPS O-acetylase OafA/YrhL
LLGTYPSPSALWIVLPAIEGLAWGCIIAGYENARFPIPSLVDSTLARIGAVSYSIYLWHHVILVDCLIRYLNMSFPLEFTPAVLFATLLFIPMVLIGCLSFELFERPFLRYRSRYSAQPDDRLAKPAHVFAGPPAMTVTPRRLGTFFASAATNARRADQAPSS